MLKRFPAALAVSVLLTVILCAAIYRYDNKYTVTDPQAFNGILVLDGEEVDGLLCLVDGWEFYQYKTLTPDTLRTGEYTPDAYIFIGQYGGFELNNPQASPYGDATYRYIIDTGNDEPKRYMLYVPEIYTAHTLWINGEMMDSADEVTSIFPLSFIAEDSIEIVINASNDSHYYSGLIYPPVFGSVKAVTTLITTKVILFTAVLIFAIVTAFFSLVVGLHYEKRALGFGCAAFSFLYAGSVSYVVVHSMSLSSIGFWYALEDVCFFGMIAVAGYLCTVITNRVRKLGITAMLFGGAVCLLRIAVTWIRLDLNQLYIYSDFLSFYKLFMIIFIIAVCVLGIHKKEIYSKALLCGVTAYAIFLLSESMVAAGYEPIRFARYSEIGGLVLTGMFGAVLLMEMIRVYREKIALSAEKQMMNLQLDAQKNQYRLMQGNIDEVKKAAHDFRHHFTVIQSMAKESQNNRLITYLQDYETGFALSEVKYCENYTVNCLAGFYMQKAQKFGIDMTIRLEVPVTDGVIDIDLAVIFGNCLENAFEACVKILSGKPWIMVRSEWFGHALAIYIDNSFDGKLKQRRDRLLSTKTAERERQGIGTASVRSVAKKYSGTASFTTDGNVFKTDVLLYFEA